MWPSLLNHREAGQHGQVANDVINTTVVILEKTQLSCGCCSGRQHGDRGVSIIVVVVVVVVVVVCGVGRGRPVDARGCGAQRGDRGSGRAHRRRRCHRGHRPPLQAQEDHQEERLRRLHVAEIPQRTAASQRFQHGEPAHALVQWLHGVGVTSA